MSKSTRERTIEAFENTYPPAHTKTYYSETPPYRTMTKEQYDALQALLRGYGVGTRVNNRDVKPPYHVIEPSLWFYVKRAITRFKNFLINKIK